MLRREGSPSSIGCVSSPVYCFTSFAGYTAGNQYLMHEMSKLVVIGLYTLVSMCTSMCVNFFKCDPLRKAGYASVVYR
ncbi:hypothetical protein TSMEX_001361 [Taenia solium]|eukprot:TsM_000339300 transcript=TsM_000339300 gene=TsM_000339300